MDIQKQAEWLTQLMQKSGLSTETILFLLGFAESLVVVSFFVPASILFLALAGLHAAAGGTLLPILIAGALGAFLGDIVSYVIGLRFRDELPKRWPFKANPHWLPQASSFIQKWGIAGVVLAKFVGPLRPLVPASCGVLQMPWMKFSGASAVSCLLWSLAFLAPAFYAAQLATR